MQQIALKCDNGKFVAAESNGSAPLIADRDLPQGWETFTIQPVAEDQSAGNLRVAIKACNGKYVSLKTDRGCELLADADGIGNDQTFELFLLSGNTIALKAANGKFVSYKTDDSIVLRANRDAIGSWEKIVVVATNPERGLHGKMWLTAMLQIMGGKREFGLRADSNKLVAAEHNGSAPLIADRDNLWGWETFSIQTLHQTPETGVHKVGILACNGKCVALQPDRKLIANADYITPEATFELVVCGQNKIGLKASNGKYVSYKMNDDIQLIANRDHVQSWERFELVPKAVPNSENVLQSWMWYYWSDLSGKRLRDITLPGTHDSGTEALQMELAPDANDTIRSLWEHGRASGATNIDGYIHDMAQCQSMDIGQQLHNGIRYIDLRVCHAKGAFYTCHSLLGTRIDDVLAQTNRFLQNNPWEIVVFKVGFKGLSAEQEAEAISKFNNFSKFGQYFPSGKGSSHDGPMNKTLQTLFDTKQRAIFLQDHDNFFSTYDGGITTNDGTINRLRQCTDAAPSRALPLEAQAFRPVSDKDYVLGYVQANGCRLIPAVPALLAAPFVGPILASVGIVALPAFVLYLKNCAPVATSVHSNSRNSRSILREYFNWLKGSNAKPTFVITDYYQQLPLVDLCICMSRGVSFDHLLMHLDDYSMRSADDPFTQVYDCSLDVIVGGFMLAGYAAAEAGEFLKNELGLDAKPVADALKSAGYAAEEIGNFLKDKFNMGEDALKGLLQEVGFPAHEVEQFFKKIFPLPIPIPSPFGWW